MNNIENTFENSTRKIQYLFEIEFRRKVDLLLMEFYPEIVNGILESYEISVEFDVLKETDPDIDYIFREAKKNIDNISNFLHENQIDSNGRLKHQNSFEKYFPITSGLDFLLGEKFIIKTFFRFHN